MFKSAIALQALALLANAATTTTSVYNPYASAFCSSVSSYATNFPHQSSGASSFCSSYFTISTSTTTTTTLSVTSVTSTYNTIAYTTTTPTSTVYTTTSTCFTPTSTPNQKRAVTSTSTYNQAASASSQASAAVSSYFSSACSCFGINIHPTATATATSVQTSFIATTTVTTSTATFTASAQTVSAAYTSYITPSGQYVASDGTLYNEYDGYDFYGNDLTGNPCGPGNTVTVNGNSYPCQNFQDCENYCSEYNMGGAQGGQMCMAVSYAESYTFCYLKFAINDCDPTMNGNVDGGLAIKAS